MGNSGTCVYSPVITSSLFFLRFPIPNEWNQSEGKKEVWEPPAEEKREERTHLCFPHTEKQEQKLLKKTKQVKLQVSFLPNNKAINNIDRYMVQIQLKRQQHQQQYFSSPQKKEQKRKKKEGK